MPTVKSIAALAILAATPAMGAPSLAQSAPPPPRPAAMPPAAPAAAPTAAPTVVPVVVPPAAPVAGPLETPPGAWTVTIGPRVESVKIGQTALDGDGTFVGSCRKGDGAGFTGGFTNYSGGSLPRVDGEIERTLFEVSGSEWKDAFAIQLRYDAASNSWKFTKSLPTVFINSFARGARLTVLNSNRDEVFAFDLTGSAVASRTMRGICGLGTPTD